jgi:LAO/AO transport system kinase
MLELAGTTEWPTHESPSSWRPPIVATVATTGEGISELWDAINDHRAHAARSGLLERRRTARLREELAEILARRLRQRAEQLCGEERWLKLTNAVVARELDPWAAADEMLGPLVE